MSWPDEAPAFKPLEVQRHADAIVPEHLDQLAALATENVEIATVRIAIKRLLNLNARVFMPRRMSVWPVAIHTRTPEAIGIIAVVLRPAPRPPPSSPRCPPRLIRIRAPVANSISIVPDAAGRASGAIRTGAKPFRVDAQLQPPAIQLAGMNPASRATAETLAPGSSDADTSCCFSAS